MILYVIDKSWEEPAKNLAYEKCLMTEMERCDRGDAILFLWQNTDVIILGRNQNVYKECNIDYVKTENIAFLRRITGGGAVYHDKGNLNYSFICKKEDYDRAFVFENLIKALADLGINAEESGRNDLVVGEKKISGCAFTEKNAIMLHHGTMLVDVNTNKMEACLTPDKAKLKSKGIPSVKSRVINLADVKENLNVEQIKQSIIERFREAFEKKGAFIKNSIFVDEKQLEIYKKEFLSEEWIYGSYPSDYETISDRFVWGLLTIHFSLDGYYVRKCNIESDTLYSEMIPKIEMCLVDMNLQDMDSAKMKCYSVCENDCEIEIVLEVLDFIERKLVTFSA